MFEYESDEEKMVWLRYGEARGEVMGNEIWNNSGLMTDQIDNTEARRQLAQAMRDIANYYRSHPKTESGGIKTNEQ